MEGKLYLSRCFENNIVNYALGIEGDEEFRRIQENFLVNYGAISCYSSPHFGTENFVYYLVDINKLRKAILEYFKVKLWLDNRNTITPEEIETELHTQKALELVNQWFDSLIKENFMLKQTLPIFEECHVAEEINNDDDEE